MIDLGRPPAGGDAARPPRTRRAWSLQARIYLLVLLAVAPALAVHLLYVRDTLQRREVDGRVEAQRLADSAAGELGRILAGQRALLVAVAEAPSVVGRDWLGCDPYLERLVRRFPEVAGMLVLDERGALRCGYPVGLAGADYADRPYFAAARERAAFTVGARQTGRITGVQMLPLALPLRRPDAGFDGIAVSGIDLEWLGGHFAARPLPEGGTLIIVDQEGRNLARVPPEPPEPPEPGAPPPDDLRAIFAAAAGAYGGGDGGVDEGGDGAAMIGGRIYGVTTLGPPAGGLAVAVGLSRAGMVAEARAAGLRAAGLAGGALALALAAAALAGRLFLRRPLAAITEALDRWRAGDMEARVASAEGGAELGRLGAALNAMADTVEERSRAIERQRERLELVADAAPALISFVDAGRRYRFVNRGYEKWFGRPRGEIVGRHMRELLGDDGYAGAEARIEAALGGAAQTFEVRATHREAGVRDMLVRFVPATRAGAPTEGFYIFVEDVTRRKREQTVQRAQNLALERAVEGADLPAALQPVAECGFEALAAGMAIFVVDPVAGGLELRAAAGVAEGLRRAVARLPVGADQPGSGRAVAIGARVIVPDVAADRRWRRHRALARDSGVAACWATPIRHLGGPPLGALTVYPARPGPPRPREFVALDALARTAATLIDRQRGEEQRRRFARELNHRVKNTLAVVQSLAAQSLRGLPGAAAPLTAFRERLRALAASHDVLTAESWSGADLADLVGAALATLQGASERCVLKGPPVRMPPRAAVTLTLALRELAANALEHGSLAAAGGRVEIRWRLEGEGAQRRLRLRWRERGGPDVAAPERRGFGTRMLEGALAQELGGTVALAFEPEGLVCEIEAPLAAPG